MNPLLEAMLGTFDLSEEVVLTIDNNGKNSYLKGRIKDIQEQFKVLGCISSPRGILADFN